MNKKRNLADLVGIVSSRTKLDPAIVEEFIQHLFEETEKGLINSSAVDIQNLGTFKIIKSVSSNRILFLDKFNQKPAITPRKETKTTSLPVTENKKTEPQTTGLTSTGTRDRSYLRSLSKPKEEIKEPVKEIKPEQPKKEIKSTVTKKVAEEEKIAPVTIFSKDEKVEKPFTEEETVEVKYNSLSEVIEEIIEEAITEEVERPDSDVADSSFLGEINVNTLPEETVVDALEEGVIEEETVEETDVSVEYNEITENEVSSDIIQNTDEEVKDKEKNTIPEIKIEEEEEINNELLVEEKPNSEIPIQEEIVEEPLSTNTDSNHTEAKSHPTAEEKEQETVKEEPKVFEKISHKGEDDDESSSMVDTEHLRKVLEAKRAAQAKAEESQNKRTEVYTKDKTATAKEEAIPSYDYYNYPSGEKDLKNEKISSTVRMIITLVIIIFALFALLYFIFPKNNRIIEDQQASQVNYYPNYTEMENYDTVRYSHIIFAEAELDYPALSEIFYGYEIFWPYIYNENKKNNLNPFEVKPGSVIRIPRLNKDLIDITNKESIDKAKYMVEQIISSRNPTLTKGTDPAR